MEVEEEEEEEEEEAGVSPPESHSLPLAPPSAHSSSPLLFCLFSSVYFSSHDSLHMASSSTPLPSLKELFPPPPPLPPPLSHGHIFCSQVADVTKRWKLAGTNLSLENIQFSLETLKSKKKKKKEILEHLAILCPVPLSTVSVITGYL